MDNVRPLHPVVNYDGYTIQEVLAETIRELREGVNALDLPVADTLKIQGIIASLEYALEIEEEIPVCEDCGSEGPTEFSFGRMICQGCYEHENIILSGGHDDDEYPSLPEMPLP